MPAVVHGERTLTDLDFSRLSKLVGLPLSPFLADLLATAEVTSSRAVRADVVTMYSRVELVDVHTHRRQVLTVCYPRDAEPAAGFISVLSPVKQPAGPEDRGCRGVAYAAWRGVRGHGRQHPAPA